MGTIVQYNGALGQIWMPINTPSFDGWAFRNPDKSLNNMAEFFSRAMGGNILYHGGKTAY
jgi:hypothetical protein